MGREIRRVPVGWEPPKKRDPNGEEHHQPQYDKPFEQAAREWMDAARAWDDGTDEHKAKYPFYWQWDGNPPDPEYYRPDWAVIGLEPTGYALYETVSEGTPVTPAFATAAELVDYLVTRGDYWDQRRGHRGWDRRAAERMVASGYAPSMVVHSTPQGTTIHEPRDMVDA